MKLFSYLTLIIVLVACQTRREKTTQINTNDPWITNHTDTVYLERNATVTPANSYSDLFLDSVDLNSYLRKGSFADEEERGLKSFYNYRNNQFAWFTSQGFTEQARGFWNLQDKLGTTADKTLRNKMDSLLNNDSMRISRYDTSILKTELALTRAWLQFYRSKHDQTRFAGVSAEKAIPVVKMNTMRLADSLLHKTADSSSADSSSQYARLKKKLERYYTVANDGDWPPLKVDVKSVAKGKSSAAVTGIKKMLQRTGDMEGTDTSAVYNDSLALAVQRYQTANGMAPTGMITDTFMQALNVPLEKRIQQIIINMYRAQWMPVSQDPNYIGVNIPDFILKVYENNKKIFEIPVAVGKEGTNTTMITSEVNQVVFSPYWNIPESIVKNEIMPKMKSNPGYLKEKNMEIVGKNDSVPTIRQLPGKGNALGKVKFLFPNRYDIYLHDTYNKEIFSKQNRALSHGCIRLQDAEKLAVYLLKNDNSWTPEKVRAAMNSGKQQYVKVTPPMPVVITYYTAWVDDYGQIHFENDLYRRDSELAKMLFDDREAGIVSIQ